jgi:DNA-binding transcriptional ArsR family regulator
MQVNPSGLLNDAQIEQAARLFAALSDPTRLRLIKALMGGPRTVTELVEHVGLRQASVSKQLGLLHDARLLRRERDGNFIRYAIADPILEPLCRLVCDRIERVAREQAKAAGLRLR